MKIVDAQFLTSAQSIADSPTPDRAEVAFLGEVMLGNLHY